jgi:very-short-patch-repair endonuclease
VGILRRELAKKRRHMPTRRLIESMPTLLPRLKPCFLMSPLSVAQFLDASLPPFDLVVFDEASQIPVWDAIGAIARGSAVIVVGDSKQLPPTTFFQSLEGEDDGAEDAGAIEDVESILKECNAAGVPSIRLTWHYRSRHESLIAFSNHHYYENELHTFPSPEDRSPRLGVTFRHITGSTYDRGGTRTNRAEAGAVVAEVVALLTDPDRSGSVGVVTFNLAQQTLIEDLLDAQRRQRPEIEPFFSSDAEEPVFVKNLESVQGDERDTIVFSVGYGPDASGRVSMNFGPLNAEGGERRLNVAVTRAKKRLIVFSSITGDQIDLRRTSALGVRHFKAFLDFAAQGAEALAVAGSPENGAEPEDGLARAVRAALTARGHAVDSRIGYGGYRIDLAVRDPARPGRYLLGIVCDGASYRAASTARDRDRIRRSVLDGLGWRLTRVWSTAWRVNPARCVEQIEREIAAASEGGPLPPAPSVTVAPEPTVTVAAVPRVEPPTSADAGEGVYVVSKPARRRRSPLDIESPGAPAFASEALRAIVEMEGPIVRDLAVRRLASWCAVPRVTERFRAFADDVEGACGPAVIAEQGVLWPAGVAPRPHVPLRLPGDDPDSRREIEHMPPAEIVGAVVLVLERQFGLPRDELVREAARLMGFARVTPRVEEAIGPAVERAAALGLASVSGDRVSLTPR